MPVYTKQYYGPVGQSWIQDSALSYVTVLHVTRNDATYSSTESAPSSLQFKYTMASGRLDFDALNPFTGPDSGRLNRNLLEKIKVTYKI